jgi:glycosyl transferase family 25
MPAMKRARILTLLVCGSAAFLCVILGAHIVAALIGAESTAARIAAGLPFLPLLINRGLFRNCRGSCGVPGKFSPGKIRIFLLNMDRATERLNLILPRISNLGFPFERISAVDGSLLSQEEIASVTDVESYKKYFRMLPEPGTVGCALSHEKAWRKFLESDGEFALIFEDDAFFDGAAPAEIPGALIERKHLWDIVGFELNHHGCPLKIAELPGGTFLAAYLTNVKHAGCYLINRRAAGRLLEKFYPIKMPVDHYYTAAWELDLKFAGVEPRPVRQKFERSQIKTAPALKLNSLRLRLSNAAYNVKRSVTHAIYNFFYFLVSRE